MLSLLKSYQIFPAVAIAAIAVLMVRYATGCYLTPLPLFPLPSGRTHDRVTLWILPPIAGSTLYFTGRADLAFWISGGYLFSGLMFGPDLDLYSVQYKRWGWLRWLWRPYQRAIRHRSIWSHGPIVGTIGRILYLGLWLGLAGCVYLAIVRWSGGKIYTEAQLVEIGRRSLDRYWSIYLAVFCGLELGAMSHYLSDWSVSFYKRLWGANKTNRKS